jgi:hypothetical protein
MFLWQTNNDFGNSSSSFLEQKELVLFKTQQKQHIETIIAGKVNVLFVLLQLKYLHVQNRDQKSFAIGL